jgi:phage terminase small subunit
MEFNARQKAFIEAYCGNATEAALKAGYSQRSAYNQGRRMMKNDEVLAAIKEREAGRNSVLIATRQERQAFWSATMRGEAVDMKDRLRASELLGKSEGDFVDRTELTGKNGGPVEVKSDIDLSKCSEEELMFLAQIVAKGGSGADDQSEKTPDVGGDQRPPEANRRRASAKAKRPGKK